MPQTDVHLVSWNRPKITELAIRTIARNTKSGNYRLIVLDNGSDKDQQNMLYNLHNDGLIDELILWDENLGLEAARQYMLNNCTLSEYFICADNDCLPPPIKDGQDWIERLVELMEKYEDFAAISCRTQVMIGTGNIFEEADAVGDDIVEFPHPGGSLRIMRTQVIHNIGGWDRDSQGRGAEERFIGSKLSAAGYRTAFATDIRCLHLFGLRGENPTDRWGYDKDLKPEDTGHSDISHPALTNGDDYEEVSLYSGEKLANDYYSDKG